MRSTWRTLPRALRRDIALVCAADGLIGISFGALATSSGLPWWWPSVISLGVFAGASQFVFLGLALAGGGVVASVLAAVLVNARLLPMAYAVGDLFTSPALRASGAHLVTDEATAFALNARPEHRRAAFWFCGLLLYAVWNAGTLVGALAGQAIEDVGALGLDAAFPAVLLALVMPALRDPRTAVAGAVGAVIALVLTPLLPSGLPVLIALSATLLALVGRPRRTLPPKEQP